MLLIIVCIHASVLPPADRLASSSNTFSELMQHHHFPIESPDEADLHNFLLNSIIWLVNGGFLTIVQLKCRYLII